MRVTHPFHPYSGKSFSCVGERCTYQGKRLLLQIDDITVCSIPPQWTDFVAPDPEVIIGGQRNLFRVADLLELAALVERLNRGRSLRGQNEM